MTCGTGFLGNDGKSGTGNGFWLWYSISLDDANDSVSPLSVSDCLDDVSMLSDEDGVSSFGRLTGLDVFDDRRGDEETLYRLNRSLFCWNNDNDFVLFGELSCKLAFLCNGVGFLKFGYKSMADAAQRPKIN